MKEDDKRYLNEYDMGFIVAQEVILAFDGAIRYELGKLVRVFPTTAEMETFGRIEYAEGVMNFTWKGEPLVRLVSERIPLKSVTFKIERCLSGTMPHDPFVDTLAKVTA